MNQNCTESLWITAFWPPRKMYSGTRVQTRATPTQGGSVEQVVSSATRAFTCAAATAIHMGTIVTATARRAIVPPRAETSWAIENDRSCGSEGMRNHRTPRPRTPESSQAEPATP